MNLISGTHGARLYFRAAELFKQLLVGDYPAKAACDILQPQHMKSSPYMLATQSDSTTTR